MFRLSKFRIYLFVLLLIVLYLNFNTVDTCEGGHGHSHGHGHGHAHSHGHGHAHDHDHGHAHHHGHAHEHSHEQEANPAYKYSRAANEQSNEHSHTKPDEHKEKHSGAEKEKRNAENIAPTKAKDFSEKYAIFIQAFTSTTLISLAPFFILFFIPINESNTDNAPLLKVLLAFASGSLLGDAFLHLIPHALEPHGTESSHSHSHAHDAGGHHDHSQQATVGLWVMGGILSFLAVEKLIMSLKGDDDHAHSHKHKARRSSEKKDDDLRKSERKRSSSSKERKRSTSSKKSEKKDAVVRKQTGDIKVAGYLNLAADFAHNFTDGLAIGASFLAGENLGYITTVTILLHEVPHEIGDFALLIQAGCSKKKAIYLQLLTALGAISGMMLSLVFESAMSGVASGCILPFTAGGFIYIATVTIIPELKENSNLIQSIKEIVALIIGVLMMVAIAYLE